VVHGPLYFFRKTSRYVFDPDELARLYHQVELFPGKRLHNKALQLPVR